MHLTQSSQTKLPITAIVVTCNESGYLDNCLSSLQWCDQLIVVDLNSTDNSVEIAKHYGAECLTHKHSPIVEPVRCFAAEHARNDWLFFVDPDEIVPQTLIKDIAKVIHQPGIGAIRLPWLFHFKGKPLNYTVWGGTHRNKKSLIHKHRCHLQPISQRGSELKEQYNEHTIEPTNDNHIKHMWIDSTYQLFEKHIRLGLNEGEGLHRSGLRFSWKRLITEPFKQFHYCLLTRGGWREGFRGFILSFVYALYHTLSSWSLKKYQAQAAPNAAHQVQNQRKRAA